MAYLQRQDIWEVSILAPRMWSNREDIHTFQDLWFQFTLPAWKAIICSGCILPSEQFQFSLPVWGATFTHPAFRWQIVISILVSRMGSDHKYSHSANIVCNFNSRSPYGERLSNWRSLLASRLFQFSFPVWGATVVGFSYDFIPLLLFIPANQEKAYFLSCFFCFFLCVAYGSRRCCLYFSLDGDSFRQIFRINSYFIIAIGSWRIVWIFLFYMYSFKQFIGGCISKFTFMFEHNEFSNSHVSSSCRMVVLKHIDDSFPKQCQILFCKMGASSS